MFYNSTDIEETLKCSFCRTKFASVVKLIPDCGESICGDCYDDLKETAAEARTFKCQTCQETHSMPESGLPDNKGLLRILQKEKIEKPLSEQAKTLRTLVKSLQSQMDSLKAFDPRDHFNQYCDQLELEVVEEIASVMKELNKIQERLLNKIKSYRDKTLNSANDTEYAGQSRPELDALTRDLAEFGAKWDGYFNQVDALATENEIQAALVRAQDFESRIRAFEGKLGHESFASKKMVFKAKSAPTDYPATLGQLFSLTVADTKALRIQETSSFTLNGAPGDYNQLFFLPDGRLVNYTDDNRIKVLSADKSGTRVSFKLRGHTGVVSAACLLGNGWLASGSGDTSIRIWDLKKRTLLKTLVGHTGLVVALRALKSGGRLASYSNDNTVRIWDPLAEDGCHLLLTMIGHGNTRWTASLFDALSNDLLVTCSHDAESKEESVIAVWSPSDGQIVRTVPTGLNGCSSLLALAGDQVAVGFTNGTLKIVDWKENGGRSRAKARAHHGVVSALAQFASNGNLLSSDGFVIKLWNSAELALLQTVQTGRSGLIDSLSLSPDERLLASASRDKTLRLWPVIGH